MKKQIKSYPLKFNKLIYLLLPLIGIISVPVISLKIINIAQMTSHSVEDYSMAIDLIVILLLVAITALALVSIFYARYIITEDYLVLRIGLFTQKIKLTDITMLTYVRSISRLVISFKSKEDLKQITISIDEKQTDDFAETLLSQNKHITYDIDSSGKDV